MDMKAFSKVNRQRCESGNGFSHRLSDWSLSDWFMATFGELGEGANVGKKLNRIRDHIPGNKFTETEEELKAALADELADTFIYLDLLCQSQEISLHAAVIQKWNKTSKKIGYPVQIHEDIQ